MPTLSLQPIVENAVRYGVTKRVEGGTVTISTRETDSSYLVTVTDDGVGYDPEYRIVFMIGFKQYAAEAFTIRADGYVMKPVTEKNT
ncbi:MAG: hypothetical protein EOM64_02035 [Erysipelotrichia bacterium]|nr:hypothetical protein [Erysipelotrichia bacterium]